MQVEFKNISYSYNKEKDVLKNINFNLKDGITVLCGDNGSGKSTLINIINFIYLPSEGDILIDNHPYNKKEKIHYRKDIATVYQFSDIELFNLTVQEDLLYAVKVQKKNIEEAKQNIIKYFKLLNLDEKILISSPFKLSGGQKKKVAIISALILQPKILILDEPLIGLDGSSKKELLNLITTLKNKMKIIIVLHNYNYIFEVADNIIELKDKKIVNNCSKEEFFQKKYDCNTNEQLSDILKVCKLLKVDFKVAKNMDKEKLIVHIKENYELH